MTIGSNFYIGRDNFFTVGKKITIGSYFFTSRNCSFICASHYCDINNPYLFQSVDCNKEIEIGSNVFVGANASIIGNVKVGSGTIIGANAVVLDDIPPFSIAVGNPAKVIKHFDFEKEKWVDSPGESSENAYFEKKYIEEIDHSCTDSPDFSYARTYKKGWL